ncbi:FtsX-like permease family protein [Nocardioides marmoribigeumensis]|uniref:ABC3 transporter permease C-terminal domain-containing protein n=1 Tax=Nocardioides marmoribigeumensis TaxID=433649 RepID=A0ABU2BWE0_9ACTN|nr:FtsX-like permease family protein [Nocardioides marmoribigeumensis]MDR7362940.1 hypothetical protein [Nocardioides marmoribigeumensis]
MSGFGGTALLRLGPRRHRPVARPVVVAFCVALVAALALVAITVALLPAGTWQAGSNLVNDPGVRGGYVVGLALCCLGPLALLWQVLRLGAAARARHLAALRTAGATAADARVEAAVATALPSVVGALLGTPLYLLARHLLGAVPPGSSTSRMSEFELQLRVVPTATAPTWWQVLLVVLLLGALGAAAGAATAGAAVRDPLGTSRRVSGRAPRPWSLLLLVPGVGLVGAMVLGDVNGSVASQVLGSLAVTCLALAFLGLGPSVAHRMGRRLSRTATSPSTMLAAARLRTDPRSTGRAAAAVGTVALAAGVCAWFIASLGGSGNGGDPIYVVPALMVLAVLGVSLLLVAVSLAAHGVETAADRRRAFAALGAQGATVGDLVAAHRREAELVVLPLAALGVTAGIVPVAFDHPSGGSVGLALGVAVGTLVLCWLAVAVSTALARPAIRRACRPENLRNG